jgi:hypothetical protein
MNTKDLALQSLGRLVLLILGSFAITGVYHAILGGLGGFLFVAVAFLCFLQLTTTYVAFCIRHVHPKGQLYGHTKVIRKILVFSIPFLAVAAGEYWDRRGYFILAKGLTGLKYLLFALIPFLVGLIQGLNDRIQHYIYERRLAQAVREKGLGPSIGSRLELNAALGELTRGENLEEATQTVINFCCGIIGNIETPEFSACIPPETTKSSSKRVVGETGHGQVAIEAPTRKEVDDELEMDKVFERVGKYKVFRTRNVIEFYYFFGSSEITSGILDPAKAVDRYRVAFDPQTFKLRYFGQVVYTDLFRFWPLVIRSKKVHRMFGTKVQQSELAYALVIRNG